MNSHPALLGVFILIGVVVPIILVMQVRRRKRDLDPRNVEIESARKSEVVE